MQVEQSEIITKQGLTNLIYRSYIRAASQIMYKISKDPLKYKLFLRVKKRELLFLKLRILDQLYIAFF